MKKLLLIKLGLKTDTEPDHISPKGPARINGRWTFSGKTFDQMFDFEKLKVSDHIVDIKKSLH